MDHIGREEALVTSNPVRPTGMEIDRGILDAAARTFAVHGYAKTSVQQLADAVGYSKTGLLHRFPSKQALHDAVLAEAADVLDAILDGSPARRALLERVAARALDRPGLVHLLVESIRPASEEPGRMALHARLLRLAGALAGGGPDEGPPHDDPERGLRVRLALRLVVDAVLAQDDPLLQVERARLQPLVVDLAAAVLGPAPAHRR
jgi:AcrR family transcriptional regulator